MNFLRIIFINTMFIFCIIFTLVDIYLIRSRNPYYIIIFHQKKISTPKIYIYSQTSHNNCFINFFHFFFFFLTPMNRLDLNDSTCTCFSGACQLSNLIHKPCNLSRRAISFNKSNMSEVHAFQSQLFHSQDYSQYGL